MRKAFTLVEMLIVICIIAILAALIVPSLGRARSLARMAVCANNLRELGHGIGLARMSGGLSVTHPYPAAEWPAVPGPQETSSKVFMCPEADSNDTLDSWTVRSNEAKDQYGNDNSMEYGFKAGANVDVVVGPNGNPTWVPSSLAKSVSGVAFPSIAAGHTQYRMDDGYVKDKDDVTWDLDGYTMIMKKVSTGYNGTDNIGTDGKSGTITLYHNGQAVPGWGINKNNPMDGKFFTIGGGSTNYAVNMALGGVPPAQPPQLVAADTIVLLDYDVIQANVGEVMSDHLTKSSRHLGKINILYADFSVSATWGMKLDKALNPDPWSP